MRTDSRSTGAITRRIALAAAALACAGGALAQSWPDRPVKLVVPFPAGGGADVAARAYGEKLAAVLGQPVVIDNKPGASGNIGAESVARASADGYTILFGNEFLATNPALQNVRYDTMKDFVPILKVASSNVAIAAHPGLPARNLAELVALGKTRELNYASPGMGTGPHLFGQLLALQAGAKFKNIPYKGTAPATADAVGGQVDFVISTLAPMVPHIQSGRLRGIAVTAGKRSPQVPDVPTLKEAGATIQPYEVWYGVLAPAKTPPAIVTRLQQASQEVLRDADTVAKLTKAGYDVDPTVGAAFGAEIKADMDRWVRVVRDAKIPRE